MNSPTPGLLTASQLKRLQCAFHQGSANASIALAKWIGKTSLVEIDSIEQLPLEEATGLLAEGDEPVCFCSAEMKGLLTGEMILVFNDANGMALADMLLVARRGRANGLPGERSLGRRADRDDSGERWVKPALLTGRGRRMRRPYRHCRQ